MRWLLLILSLLPGGDSMADRMIHNPFPFLPRIEIDPKSLPSGITATELKAQDGMPKTAAIAIQNTTSKPLFVLNCSKQPIAGIAQIPPKYVPLFWVETKAKSVREFSREAWGAKNTWDTKTWNETVLQAYDLLPWSHELSESKPSTETGVRLVSRKVQIPIWTQGALKDLAIEVFFNVDFDHRTYQTIRVDSPGVPSQDFYLLHEATEELAKTLHAFGDHCLPYLRIEKDKAWLSALALERVQMDFKTAWHEIDQTLSRPISVEFLAQQSGTTLSLHEGAPAGHQIPLPASQTIRFKISHEGKTQEIQGKIHYEHNPDANRDSR